MSSSNGVVPHCHFCMRDAINEIKREDYLHAVNGGICRQCVEDCVEMFKEKQNKTLDKLLGVNIK